jgi:uncharacterized membrane protein YraQ (UPF0718 family)
MDLQELIDQRAVWIASALGAILLSVLSNLITPFFKAFLAKLSTRVRERQTQKKKSMGRAIEALRQDSTLLLNWKITVLQQVLWEVLLQLFAISGILLGGKIAGALVTLFNRTLFRFCVSGDNQPLSLERRFDYATDQTRTARRTAEGLPEAGRPARPGRPAPAAH